MPIFGVASKPGDHNMSMFSLVKSEATSLGKCLWNRLGLTTFCTGLGTKGLMPMLLPGLSLWHNMRNPIVLTWIGLTVGRRLCASGFGKPRKEAAAYEKTLWA